MIVRPQLLELRRELGVLDLRVEDLIGRLQSGEAAPRWSDAVTAYARIRTASKARRPADASAPLTELGAVLADTETWAELGEFIDRRARVVRTESRRLKDLHQMVTVERVWALVSALVQSVRTHISDRDTLIRIQRDFRQLTGRAEEVVSP